MANEVQATGGAGAAKGTDRLGTERIGRLLLEFSIPAIISMVFNSLYNVVDTAFLGQAFPDGTGVAVTTLALPVMTILMGFSMVAGQGGNALAAIQLGEGRKAQVENCLLYTSFPRPGRRSGRRLHVAYRRVARHHLAGVDGHAGGGAHHRLLGGCLLYTSRCV